jgi:hypothetical protein
MITLTKLLKIPLGNIALNDVSLRLMIMNLFFWLANRGRKTSIAKMITEELNLPADQSLLMILILPINFPQKVIGGKLEYFSGFQDSC